MTMAFVAISLLGGCSAKEKVTELFADPIILPCPDNRILADAAEFIQYREGGGRDLTDVDFSGNIANMGLACLTRIDKKTKVGEMEVEVGFSFIATRGPANKTRKAQYPYFIVVTNIDKEIVYRERFDIGVDFIGNSSRFTFKNEPITIVLPLRPDVTDKNYLIYGGFELSREQLQLNRLRREQLRR